jgi:hypothetical protein
LARAKVILASNKTMQFSKFDEGPQLLEAMRAAFDRVCDVLQLNGDREDPLTELVVTKIVELAKAGELDPVRLRNDVLAELQAPRRDAGQDARYPKQANPPHRKPAIASAQGRVLNAC